MERIKKGGIRKNNEQKIYQVIYADLPWQYHSGKVSGSAASHYMTMPIEDICALPVEDIAGKDCALFFMGDMLPEALRVLNAWGFSFKTVAFVWIKKNKKADSLFYGLGYWTRGNAEICLLGVKGRPQRQSKRVFQVIVSPVEQHSKKPDDARRRIEELMGDVPCVELFARQKSPGWDAWGNEIQSNILLEQKGE